jgi:hypothetical protein
MGSFAVLWAFGVAAIVGLLSSLNDWLGDYLFDIAECSISKSVIFNEPLDFLLDVAHVVNIA